MFKSDLKLAEPNQHIRLHFRFRHLQSMNSGCVDCNSSMDENSDGYNSFIRNLPSLEQPTTSFEFVEPGTVMPSICLADMNMYVIQSFVEFMIITFNSRCCCNKGVSKLIVSNPKTFRNQPPSAESFFVLTLL